MELSVINLRRSTNTSLKTSKQQQMPQFYNQTERISHRYSNKTLVGNWFADRQSLNISSDVMPGAQSSKVCGRYETTYKSDFNTNCKPTAVQERMEEFNNWRGLAFKNCVNSQTSQIRAIDSDDFMQNFTTTTHLSYGLVPQMETTNLRRGARRTVPRIDHLESFGNATNFGLRKWKHCNELRNKLTLLAPTTYVASYNRR